MIRLGVKDDSALLCSLKFISFCRLGIMVRNILCMHACLCGPQYSSSSTRSRGQSIHIIINNDYLTSAKYAVQYVADMCSSSIVVCQDVRMCSMCMSANRPRLLNHPGVTSAIACVYTCTNSVGTYLILHSFLLVYFNL